MKKFFNISLKTKIILMALGLNLALVLGAFLSIDKLAKAYEYSHFAEFEAKTQALSTAIANQFFERYGDVQAFTKNESIRLFHTNRMQTDLNEYVVGYGIYDLILILDKNGKLVQSNSFNTKNAKVNQEALSKTDFSQKTWFKAALNGNFTVDKEKGFDGSYVSELENDPDYLAAFGEEAFIITFSAQIKNYNGDVVGVLATKSNTK